MDAPQTIIGILSWLLGGLALFLYGIDMMGRSLRKAAGSTLRRGLDRLTRTRIHGLVTGTATTALLQSSSAATVMIVGFISAGLLTFPQSIGLIIGANLGSSITPFIATLELEKIALPALAIGFLLHFTARRRNVRKLGLACMGFGMLFLGLLMMKSAISEHKDVIQGWLNTITTHGFQGQLLAFAVAVAVTSIIQSSGATVVVVAKLAEQGAIQDVGIMIPMILGAHVGTCVTALLASLNASRSAKRAAATHLVFNVIGVAITIILFPVYVAIIPRFIENAEYQVVFSHFAIKAVNALLFLPFTPQLARLASRLVPGKDQINRTPEFLDYRSGISPDSALDSAAREIRRLCSMGMDIIRDAVTALLSGDEVAQELVLKREDAIDDLQKTVADYVCSLSEHELPTELSSKPALLLRVMAAAERIGDHAENIVETSGLYARKHLQFSSAAQQEISELISELSHLGEQVLDMMDNPTDEKATAVLGLREKFETRINDMISHHRDRLERGPCMVLAGIVFTDVLTNLQSVAKHLRDIARDLAGNNGS